MKKLMVIAVGAGLVLGSLFAQDKMAPKGASGSTGKTAKGGSGKKM